jgi:8-oxo-dGTP diphosphatase
MHRFKMIASVYLILVKNNKILLLRRQNTGYEDGNWSFPAGHVENKETLTSACYREIKEEIGLNLKPNAIKLVHIMHRKEKDIRLDFFFTIEKWFDNINNCEPEKCSQLKWFPLDKLPVNTIPYIRRAIHCYSNNIWFSEFGW